ncbi:MAG: glycosyltransferase [Lachnospiraceae bacterium]|nr:glycosyltransferase [Lachnospiraceae bacterium]
MRDSADKLINILSNKKVLFIATKNRDYIRVVQEIELLRSVCASVKILSFPDKGYLKRIIKVYGYLIFGNIKEYDIVFIGFMPQMIVPFFRRKLAHKKIIIDFFISVYDTLVDDRKVFSASSLIGRILKRIDKKTINCADYIIADTNAHGRYFVNELEASEKKVLTLYLNADKKVYYPRYVKRPEEYKGKFLVIYFGSILPVQGVEVILKCIYKLRKNNKIHFIMIGPINKKYKKVMTDNVTYINWLSQDKLAEYIAFSDLCLGGHFSDTIGKAARTIPGKVYIYKAMNKKVVLGDSPANRELYEENKDNIYVPRGNAKALALTIIKEWENTTNAEQISIS